VVCGTQPGGMLPADLLDAGPGRIRALLLFGANPVLSSPGGDTLEKGLQQLDLMVSCDLYLNETNRHAHYLLPGLSFLERDDIPLYGLLSLMRPFVQYSDAVVEPAGEARNEFDVLADIARRLGKTIEADGRPLAAFDAMLRNGPAGDLFGAREGWSFERLRAQPHGVMLDLPDPTEGWEEKIGFPDRKFRLWHAEIGSDLAHARASAATPPGSLKLIGRRDIRSMNSWMHNIVGLSRSQSPALLIHPDDAQSRAIADGDSVRIWTRFGEVVVVAKHSRDMVPGAVCYPHGWGHVGGWKVANAKSGANINRLLGFGADTVERLAGMTLMDGLPVEVERAWSS
jgi:anaerobic selenocysteine-containing dehydrogenase